MEGARSKPLIDVDVTFRQHGIACRWVVECKLWKKRVEKANVLTLKAIVEDVGADRGIIFCENDFQSGARDAARHTNILLVTSLEEFKRTVRLTDKHFAWVDPLSQALYGDKLISVNRNNRELVVLDKRSGHVEQVAFLGDAPNGPDAVVVVGDEAIISYPERRGLIFHNLRDVAQ